MQGHSEGVDMTLILLDAGAGNSLLWKAIFGHPTAAMTMNKVFSFTVRLPHRLLHTSLLCVV